MVAQPGARPVSGPAARCAASRPKPSPFRRVRQDISNRVGGRRHRRRHRLWRNALHGAKPGVPGGSASGGGVVTNSIANPTIIHSNAATHSDAGTNLIANSPAHGYHVPYANHRSNATPHGDYANGAGDSGRRFRWV